MIREQAEEYSAGAAVIVLGCLQARPIIAHIPLQKSIDVRSGIPDIDPLEKYNSIIFLQKCIHLKYAMVRL